jgi:hypothetical protein
MEGIEQLRQIQRRQEAAVVVGAGGEKQRCFGSLQPGGAVSESQAM